VVVANHVHLVTGRKGDGEMRGTARDLKKYTSAQLFGAVTENPAGTGFVDGPPHYLYGSARDYARPDVFVWLVHPRKPEGLPHDRHKSRFAKTCASGGQRQGERRELRQRQMRMLPKRPKKISRTIKRSTITNP
jgi:hypothetical protein